MARSLPDKPSIAVLAFTNMSGDPDQEYFSDGIADDIITELSRSRSLFVIARNSSFTYKGRRRRCEAGRPATLACATCWKARCASGGRVRVTAQLIDAETGITSGPTAMIANITEIFAVQDDIAESGGNGNPSGGRRCGAVALALRKPPASLSAWETLSTRSLAPVEGHGSGKRAGYEISFYARRRLIDFGFAPAYVAFCR